MREKIAALVLGLAMLGAAGQVQAAIGFADVVLAYFDSGVGPMAGPYGGTFPGSFPVPVSTSVVLGNDLGPIVDFLSLPTGSFVTVGLTDETVVDGPGNDIFIQEVGVGGEQANVFVSADGVNFTLLGVANDSVTTSFDLSSISFVGAVQAIKIVGLDNGGGSPGFDVVNVQVLPGSIGPAPVPEPASLTLWGLGALGCAAASYRRRKVAA